jgi:hypothetical protein
MTVLNERITKEETVKSTITSLPSIKEFLERRRRKRKPTNEVEVVFSEDSSRFEAY